MHAPTLELPLTTGFGEALEAALDSVERSLGALGTALRERDAAAVERHAGELHRALAAAIQRLGQASRQPSGVPQALRLRMAAVGGQVAAQRENVARASAAIERGIEVLMPTTAPLAMYGQGGHSERSATSGCVHA
jgi:hypothetical protein